MGAELGADSDTFLKLSEDERCRALYGIGLDAAPPRGFIAMHPGSGGRRKCWPAERYARLAVKLACRDGAVPLVFFGPADSAVRDEFETAMPPGIEWQAADCRPLREVLALLSSSRGYVGNDSGMTHLAAHACPTVVLFGPSNPHVWAPLGKNVRIVQAPDGELARLSVDEVQTHVEFWLTNSE
jgi:heptosyltransferase-2